MWPHSQGAAFFTKFFGLVFMAPGMVVFPMTLYNVLALPATCLKGAHNDDDKYMELTESTSASAMRLERAAAASEQQQPL